MSQENSGQQFDSIEEWVNSEGFEHSLQAQFPRAAAALKRNGMDRRTFLRLMGASLAAAGLQGCVAASAPDEQIIPYAIMPEIVVPGNPIYFATSVTLGGFATGVLIETHEGRPHRVEGNPSHPASLGGLDAISQANILELYNPERSRLIRGEGQLQGFTNFRNRVIETMDGFAANGGEGLRILTGTVTSPTLVSQMEEVLERFPNARWHQYDPVSRDSVVDGAQLAFGEAVDTVYDFAEADVVLSLDADFLTAMPGSVRYARDFMAKRKIREGVSEMNRLYAVNSTPTNVSALADHTLSLRAGDIASFAAALADALGVSAPSPASTGWDAAWLDTLAEDLQAAGSNALVVAGINQPAVVHALAHAINDALGAVGTTVTYTEPVAANPVNQTASLTELVQDMRGGDVDALFIVGGNPVYDSPADLDFANALGLVPFSAHLSLYFDETSQLCTWHIPQAHAFEAWSDARAYDGTASIIQPPIGPLYERVRSAHEFIATLTNDRRSGYEIVRATWQEEASGDFEAFWRQAVHDGFIPDSAPAAASPSVSGDLASAEITASDGLEVVFRPDPYLWDGQFAFNPWLHELPRPLTNLTWDNAALMSAATAAALGVASNDLVDLSLSGNTMQVPVLVVSGHADDSITVQLGYGRGIGGDIEAGLDFNAYTIRQSTTPWFASGPVVSAAGREYNLAVVRGDEFVVDRSEAEAIRHATFATFMDNPTFVEEKEKFDEPRPDLLPEFEYDDNSWGMTIDLTACMGCNACVIACQTENNIPTVGKEAVEAGREMHWLRIDLYDIEDVAGQINTGFQPVPCMHCENAPCEQVCPVQATVHSSEGLNQMVYNRCVGTRYCSANCPYGVRRFNFFDYIEPLPIYQEFRNPDVSVRAEGVMEKCTYCTQRISAARAEAKKEDRPIADGEVVPACASACPTQAIVFGNLNDSDAEVVAEKAQPHNYGLLAELNTQPRTTYLARISNPNSALGGEE